MPQTTFFYKPGLSLQCQSNELSSVVTECSNPGWSLSPHSLMHFPASVPCPLLWLRVKIGTRCWSLHMGTHSVPKHSPKTIPGKGDIQIQHSSVPEEGASDRGKGFTGHMTLDLDHEEAGACKVEEVGNGIPGRRSRNQTTEHQKNTMFSEQRTTQLQYSGFLRLLMLTGCFLCE